MSAHAQAGHPTRERIVDASAELFRRQGYTGTGLKQIVTEIWITAATEYFSGAGIDRARARELAFSMLCLLEGAFVFSRAMRTTEPLEIAGATAAAAVEEALAAAGSHPPWP
jgi:hypothetical protein